ncbi:MAG: hypothetical protein AAF680_14050 [Pseudomonadota bacterium]
MAKDDDIGSIPSISASREGATTKAAVPRPRGSARKGGGRSGGRGDGASTGGIGIFGGVTLFIAFCAALAACAWAWQLQEQLTQAGHVLERYEIRIGDLEARLADTDEGMSQNAAVQAAKLRELDSEVRKLWDNVWKKSKERLGILEASAKRFDGSITANSEALSATQQNLTQARDDIASLKRISGDLERLMASAQRSQSEVERVADTLNRISLDLTKLNKRVGTNEEWISSINSFRQSTSRNISQLQDQLRALQTPTSGQ